MRSSLICAAISLSRTGRIRAYNFGCVAIRGDGTLVQSVNGGTPNQIVKPSHAEARIVKKLDYGATVYVARTKKDLSVGIARPCLSCMNLLRFKYVKRVYYTISEKEYGVIIL